MDVVPTIDPTNRLLPLEHRATELGRIRLGAKAETANGKEYPKRLETFRLTSGQRGYLEAAAALYGGTVQAWEDAPDEGYWELFTEASELHVLIPRALRTVSQAYEYWQGGTCERRCDGTTEQISQRPCLCDGDVMECKPVTRVSVMLHRLPGLGTWRLDTGGWQAATSIPATIQLLTQLSEQPWIPAILRLEQRSKKVRDDAGKVETHRFAVPVLDLPNITVGQVVARQGTAEAPQLPAERPQVPTASERVAQQAAAITSGSVEPARSEDGPEQAEEAGVGQPSAAEPPPADHADAAPGAVDGTSADQAASAPTDEAAPPDTSASVDDASPAEPTGDSSAAPEGTCGSIAPEPDPLGLREGGPCAKTGPCVRGVHQNEAGHTWAVEKKG